MHGLLIHVGRAIGRTCVPLALLSASLFSAAGFSQADCLPDILPEKGATWEITQYDGDGYVTGRVIQKVLDRRVGENYTTYTIRRISQDAFSGEIFTDTYKAECRDGIFRLDIEAELDSASFAEHKTPGQTVKGTNLVIPHPSTPVGTKLPDASMAVSYNGPKKLIKKFTFRLTNRKVNKKERVTTPAGQFDCIVIVQKIRTKILLNIGVRQKEWYAEEIGLVRSETYNWCGKLDHYSELTRLDFN